MTTEVGHGTVKVRLVVDCESLAGQDMEPEPLIMGSFTFAVPLLATADDQALHVEPDIGSIRPNIIAGLQGMIDALEAAP